MADDIDEEQVPDDEVDIEDLELQLKTDDLVRHFHDDVDIYENMLVEKPNKTRNILNKYEKARMIGIRAQQIQSGAKPLVDIGDERDPIKMALMEMDQKVIPFLVKRNIPGKDPKNPNFEVVSPNNIINPNN